MEDYSADLEKQMGRFFRSLNEHERRRYAAIEASKLGHGGIEYVSRIFGCDSKTIKHGMAEIQADQELDNQRQRKKGVDAKN
jgi:hypothetical protein